MGDKAEGGAAMTADELARLKHDVENLDECDPNYDVELARILNAAPALIALAEWAIEYNKKLFEASLSSDPHACGKAVQEALDAYPEGE